MGLIMLLGGSGMLGHKLVQELHTRNANYLFTVRQAKDESLVQCCQILNDTRAIYGIDVKDWIGLKSILINAKPDVLINCIGVIKQRPNADDYVDSIELNSLLPHRLATLCSSWGGRLIHFSTDCVFDGTSGYYNEYSNPNATDVYGRTKGLGEVTYNNSLTLRTSIIGRELQHFQSLLEWFLAQQGGVVYGYRKVMYSGITTNFLARTVCDLIFNHQHLSGLYHIVGAAISKYDLLLRLKEVYSLNVDVRPDGKVVCDRTMDGSKFVKATGINTPSWDDLLKEISCDTTPYAQWNEGVGR